MRWQSFWQWAAVLAMVNHLHTSTLSFGTGVRPIKFKCHCPYHGHWSLSADGDHHEIAVPLGDDLPLWSAVTASVQLEACNLCCWSLAGTQRWRSARCHLQAAAIWHLVCHLSHLISFSLTFSLLLFQPSLLTEVASFIFSRLFGDL